MASPPYGKGYTPAQWEAWFAQFTKANPKIPRYTGDNKLAKGKTWDQVYKVLYAYSQAHPPKGTPDQVAQAEIDLIQAEAVANGIGATFDFTGTTVEVAGKSAISGIDQLIGQLQGPLAIFGDLTSANLWIRVGKVVFGGILLTVGIIKLTGADKTAGGIAAKAVKVAPLL